HHPLFQVAFAWQNNTLPDLDLPDLQATVLPAPTGTAKFDLSIHLIDPGTPDRDIPATIEYATDLFDRTTIDTLTHRYLIVLHTITTDPHTRLSDIDLLNETERHQILHTWNNIGDANAIPVPVTTVPDMFEHQVRSTPDQVAVTCDGEHLTYTQLNENANRWAHHLIHTGAGPEHLIAVALPRSAELITVLLAVLKTGAAYLPLDPNYPSDRTGHILDDAHPHLLITDTTTATGLPTTPIRQIHTDTTDLHHQPTHNPGDTDRTTPLHPGHPAYLIYTSGSTGTPKGVAVPHTAIANRLDWTQRCYPLTTGDAVLQKTSISFDVSVWELFWPLQVGARLVIAPPDAGRDPTQILRVIRQHRVTVVHFVPSALAAAVEHPDFARCTGLRHIIASGEALYADLARHCRTALPTAQLHNLYGPTETAVDVTLHRVADADFAPGAAAGVPIGEPAATVQAYVLDTGLRPVPAGVPGELYIAGEQVARGYHRRPAQTAGRFLPNPFATDGTRMYRTGDLVRWTADGVLDFLGRTDDQVKIRGFRIEPGEIEATLTSHPAVRQAAVITRPIPTSADTPTTGDASAVAGDTTDDKRLIGYVVLDPHTHPNHQDETGSEDREPIPDFAPQLRAYVAGKLPEYMVPAAIVILDALPVTANGKLDRKALPAPDYTTGHYRAPRTPDEHLLTDLFGHILGVPRAGIDDSFFDLGGHSLLATRLISRIRTELGAELPIRVLFDAPTIAELAPHLGGNRPVRPALVTEERPDHIPLSHAQQRLWFLHRFEGPSATYNIPLALRLHGPLNTDALTTALGDLITRHEPLRTLFGETEGQPFQHILPPDQALIDIPITDLSPATGPDRNHLDDTDLNEGQLAEAVAEAVIEAARHRFDLAHEIPIRATVFRSGPDEHVLILLIHHIAADGWSLAPLIRDLTHAYTNRHHHREPVWEPLPVQYADYTLWQHHLLGETTDPDSLITAQYRYWHHELAGAPDLTPLPTDRPRPKTASYRGDTATFTIPATLHRRLDALARQHGITMSMLTQSALAVLLHKHGAGTDICIGGPIAGRTDTALTNLIGFFVNTWVLRVDLSHHPRFDQILDQVRGKALSAYTHQDLPFELLVELLNP
ncbi:amino acid adenylation domain-containing protein, partial [Rhodococcus sp. NPDC049939]|uniref:amino acid adenylation domain-containing protein n=1 Tax=Rhodococcus sp. NPDC049939 TaxID=3155511 RepID=UPI00340F3DEB